jgi:hypothetical protein
MARCSWLAPATVACRRPPSSTSRGRDKCRRHHGD